MAQQEFQDEARAYRRALGAFATGVALVSTDHGGEVAGLIINSFTSVSLEPRLVLWCLGNDSDRFPIFAGAETWGVSFLGVDHRTISDRLSRRGARIDPEVGFERLNDVPVLGEAVGALVCRTSQRVEAGDHMVIIGEVLGYADSGAGAALTYFRGAYGATGGGL